MEPGFRRVAAKKPMDAAARQRVLAELHRETAARAKGYRERALKLQPHVCASCAREFSGPRLKELTVHHKDHNHDNNPPDGSNWELLCVYCHDHEHEKHAMAGHGGGASADQPEPSTLFNPFEALDTLVRPGDERTEEPSGKPAGTESRGE